MGMRVSPQTSDVINKSHTVRYNGLEYASTCTSASQGADIDSTVVSFRLRAHRDTPTLSTFVDSLVKPFTSTCTHAHTTTHSEAEHNGWRDSTLHHASGAHHHSFTPYPITPATVATPPRTESVHRHDSHTATRRQRSDRLTSHSHTACARPSPSTDTALLSGGGRGGGSGGGVTHHPHYAAGRGVGDRGSEGGEIDATGAWGREKGGGSTMSYAMAATTTTLGVVWLCCVIGTALTVIIAIRWVSCCLLLLYACSLRECVWGLLGSLSHV